MHRGWVTLRGGCTRDRKGGLISWASWEAGGPVVSGVNSAELMDLWFLGVGCWVLGDLGNVASCLGEQIEPGLGERQRRILRVPPATSGHKIISASSPGCSSSSTGPLGSWSVSAAAPGRLLCLPLPQLLLVLLLQQGPPFLPLQPHPPPPAATAASASPAELLLPWPLPCSPRPTSSASRNTTASENGA